MFTIADPTQRWVFGRSPAINPAFALAEVIWILAGDNESDFPNYWNSQLPNFAGQGEKYHGAYGHRLGYQFKIDQIKRAYSALKHKPESRQVALQIWHPKLDLPKPDGSPADKDIPCNIVSLLKVRDGKLEWTQIMRSNDIFLGTPHNFVQFTSLQEIMAGWLELDIGHYHHYSDSLHLYKKQLAKGIGFIETGTPVINEDSLALSKNEFDEVFDRVKRYAYSITEGRMDPQSLIRTIEEMRIPTAYQNIVALLACEAARREGWDNLIEELISLCDNPMYLHLWEQWNERVS